MLTHVARMACCRGVCTATTVRRPLNIENWGQWPQFFRGRLHPLFFSFAGLTFSCDGLTFFFRWPFQISGKQLCGTCIVEIMDGLGNCSRRGIDEASTLRENPLDYRLSCVTDVYGDVTVRVQGKVGAAQWTR